MTKKQTNQKTEEQKLRDEEGQLISKAEAEKRDKELAGRTPVEHFSHNTTHFKELEDDKTLIDLHVGNPLRKITELLEDIKKQKAFSFTLKGSLGVAGVVLALSAFGLFGGSQMLCDKGTQSLMGYVRVLQTPEIEKSDVPLLGPVIDFYSVWFTSPKPVEKFRTVLITQDSQTIHLPYSRFVNYLPYVSQNIIATGNYNSCGKTLKITDPINIEIN